MEATVERVPVLPGGYGRSSYWVGPKAPRLQRGRAAEVLDEDGRWLIDANNNFAVLILGHGNPAVSEAIALAAAEGTCFGMPNQWEEQLAHELLDRVHFAEQVRFANSGTEAVMTAIRLARSITRRTKVLGVAGSYHGSSDTALAIRGDGAMSGVPASVANDVVTVPLNDTQALGTAFAQYGDELAMMLIDLLPNYAGFEQIDEKFVTTARELCDARGVVLTFDEVVSFRLERGGLQSRYPVSPDLTVLGKLIGGGLPIGAVVGKESVMEHLSPSALTPLESSGTFTGNPVSIRAGLACLAQYDESEIRRLNALGQKLRESIENDLPSEWKVKGVGSLVRVMQPTAGSNAPERHAFWWGAYRRGLVLMPSGLMALSTPMSEQTIATISEIVLESASDAASVTQTSN